MTPFKRSSTKSLRAIRSDLAARLRARIAEIESVIFRRIQSRPDPAGDEDPTYVAGLQRTVTEALNYGLESIEEGGESPVPIPSEIVRQARRAARQGVRLDTVLLRYAAGNKVLEEFVVAEADGISNRMLCQILNSQSPHIDRLMESVAGEYQDELEQVQRSSVQKEADLIVKLLNGHSLVSVVDLDYDFDIWHLGMILVGHNVEKSARAITELHGNRSLLVERDHEATWIWLSGTTPPVVANLERLLMDSTPAETSVAVGEPRKDLNGWRQTHHEAQMALQVMLYRPQQVTRCRDVILISAILRDQSLALSLIETYLTPLNGRGRSGEALRATLRAYFKADQNIASAAVALGVARHTVERRLRSVEKKLGQTLNTCSAQLQVALDAEELVTFSSQERQPSSV
jgi:hypothetical protein